MNTMKAMLMLVGAGLLATGCLVDETTHGFYLHPDGGVTWTVRQEDVRSNSEERRTEEEETFLANVRVERHAVALAFDLLAARRVETLILRDARPYTVVTRARFARIDRVLQNLLDGLCVRADVELRREGDEVQLTVDYSPDVVDDCESDQEEILSALVEEPEHFRFVLSEGRFVEAEGFEIARDGLLARGLRPSEEEVENHHGTLSYSLTWRVPDD